ncbi:MAG: chromate transporter [Clostridium sp.]|nr:chromate transporter [Clostridium sp.]
MIFLRLFLEFFRTGLFAIGGGMATIPFLQDISRRTGWFTSADLTTMIAVSESTPGPIGVNMATYVGFTTAGPLGAAVATLGLVTPSVIVIIIIAGFLQKFRQSRLVNQVFYGLRPASTALITSAGLSVTATIFIAAGSMGEHTVSIRWPSVILAAAVFTAMRLPKLKKLHPILFIGISALIGVVLKL